MEKKTFEITLADDSKISGLGLNGNNFVSQKQLTEATFAGKLGHVVISGDKDADEAGLIGEHGPMELVQIKQYGSEWWFILRDIPASELATTKIQGDIAYLSMMSGIDLD